MSQHNTNISPQPQSFDQTELNAVTADRPCERVELTTNKALSDSTSSCPGPQGAQQPWHNRICQTTAS